MGARPAAIHRGSFSLDHGHSRCIHTHQQVPEHQVDLCGSSHRLHASLQLILHLLLLPVDASQAEVWNELIFMPYWMLGMSRVRNRIRSGVEEVENVLLELGDDFVLGERGLSQARQQLLGSLFEFFPLLTQLFQFFLKAPVLLLHDWVVLLVLHYLQVLLTTLPAQHGP